MSIRYVLDSWAWIEYLDGTAYGATVQNYIKKGAIFTSSATIAEVVSKVQRKGKDPITAYGAITALSGIVPVDSELAMETGILHAEIKKAKPNFSFGDAFALQTARRLKARIVTGDPDFKGIKDAIMLA